MGPPNPDKTFNFNACFDSTAGRTATLLGSSLARLPAAATAEQNDAVYLAMASPLVAQVLLGFNGTLIMSVAESPEPPGTSTPIAVLSRALTDRTHRPRPGTGRREAARRTR